MSCLSQQERTRNATKKHRRQFCYMINMFGGSPEILEIMALFSSSRHLTPQSADVILFRAETIKSLAVYLIHVHVGLFSLVATFQKITNELRF